MPTAQSGFFEWVLFFVKTYGSLFLQGAGTTLLIALTGTIVGFIIGHVTPEAIEGGNIALAKTGDRVRIDADKNTIDLLVSDDELTSRRKTWKKPPYKVTRGTLYKYIKNVKDASQGCVTDE